MDCRDFSENLQAYLDNELPEIERVALEEHLQTCTSCTEELRELSMVNRVLEKAFASRPPAGGFMARVIAKITGAAPAQKKAAPAQEEEKDPSTSLVGQTLAGYKILEKIGSGGMGTVYRAVQLSMSRDVALKVLYHRYSQDENFVKRFIREARSAGGLNHSNIVRVYDVGHEGGFYYMSQEFVQGRSALQILASEGRMSPERALDVTIQVARALEHAQKRSIIHRDVKPENLIVNDEGHVKLADLGLAKKTGVSQDASVTMEGQVMGTPQYMSPEQVVDSSNVDHRTDIYSLGASLYYMVTGERPFEGKTSMEAMVAVIHDSIEFTREHLAFVPKQIVKIVQKMTEKDPAKRYQTATELIRDLEYVRNRPLTYQAPAAPPRSRAVRTAAARREREPSSAIEKKASNYMWLAAVAAGLLLVIGLWVVLSTSKPERQPDKVREITHQQEQRRETPPLPAPSPTPRDVEVARKPDFEGEAKKEWEAAVKFRTEHPEEYAEILDRFQAIFQGYPSSKYASKAQTVHGETVKKLDSMMSDIKSRAEELRKVSNYNGAIALWAEFEEKCAGTEFADTAASYRVQLGTQQRARFNRDIKAAKAKQDAGDFDGAIWQVEKVAEYGTREMAKQALALKAEIETTAAAIASEKKSRQQEELLVEFYRQTAENMMDGQYVRAVESIETAASDPHFAIISDYINLERADILRLMDMKKVLSKAFKKMESATLDSVINLRDRDKAVVGRVKEISPDVFVLTPKDKGAGTFVTLNVGRLAPGEVVRLTKDLFADASQARNTYYLFYLYEGDFAKAVEYLDKLTGRKRTVVEKKQAKTPPEEKKETGEELAEASERLKELMKKYGQGLDDDTKKQLEKEIGKLAQDKPGAKPGGQKGQEVAEEIVDPGDPKYAICYMKYEVVKPIIAEVLRERNAKKLYDSGKLAYRKKDYEEAQDCFERLLSEEFSDVNYLDETKREEIAKLLKNIDAKSGRTLAKKDIEKDDIASLFNASKIEKLRNGKYRVTYDFTTKEQLKDFMINRDLLKDERIEELFGWRDKKVTNYEEVPAWSVVRYQKYSMVNGKGDRTFCWKGIVDGDVTIEFSAIPMGRENVVAVLHNSEEGGYMLATSFRGGDGNWHREKFGLTRSVIFRRYWDDDPRVRLPNGGWQVIGGAGKIIVNPRTHYAVKAVKKENKLTFSINGQRYVEGMDNTWHKGRAGVWAPETNVLYTNIRITGTLDKEWVEKELERLGRKKKEEEKKDKTAQKEDPYKDASESTKRLLDQAKKINDITNEDLIRLRKIADLAETMGPWGQRAIDGLSREIGRMDVEELRRRLDEIERWLDNAGRGGPPGPGGGGWPGGGRPGGGRGGGRGR